MTVITLVIKIMTQRPWYPHSAPVIPAINLISNDSSAVVAWARAFN